MMPKRLPIWRATGWVAALFLLAGVGTAHASFLVPQIHHPGEFFEKYATPLPYFDGNSGPLRVDGGTAAVDVNYVETRQPILPDTFYTGGGPLALPALASPYRDGTLVWAYDVGGSGPLFPGVTIEAEKHTSTQVTYTNNLPNPPELQPHLSIDQTIHWANPLEVPGPPVSRLELPPYAGPQPVVTHLHGGEVPSSFDGAPDQWVTSNGIKGPGYRTYGAAADNQFRYLYPNDQEAATLWFHDHTLGITRINVYAGVAAYYFLRDGFDTGDEGTGLGLPSGKYEVEAVIQDRMFDVLGNLLFPDGPPFFVPNPQHPFWNPEFLGDVNVVNGRSWPYLSVEQRRYRIRLLNGSNARFYTLSLAATGKGKKVKAPMMYVIGTDGGLLDRPVGVDELTIAPGERYDVIIDFAGIPEGTIFQMNNTAKAPFPFGETANPQTVGQVMQFKVGGAPAAADLSYNPDPNALDYGGPLRDGTAATPDPIVRLAGYDAVNHRPTGTLAANVVPDRTRQLTLNEIPGPFGPLDAVLNNSRWGGMRDDGSIIAADPDGPQGLTLNSGTVAGETNYLTELPQVGSTEIWEIINLTGDAHPIHLHLVQFQVLNRQGYNVKQYEREYLSNFPGGAAANPNQGFFIPHYGPPLPYNDDQDPGPREVIGGNPLIDPFLSRSIEPPKPYEAGWKDTVIALPKQVTRIVVRWTPTSVAVGSETPGTNQFSDFDPTIVGSPAGGIVGADGGEGPGYVWHCHIIDHEDNEMMRPYAPVQNANNVMDP